MRSNISRFALALALVAAFGAAAQAGDTKQAGNNLDLTVRVENGAITGSGVHGGKGEIVAASIYARDGATQTFTGTVKSHVEVKNGAIVASGVLGGNSRAILGSAVAE